MKIKKVSYSILLISVLFLSACQKRPEKNSSNLIPSGEAVKKTDLKTHKDSHWGMEFKHPEGLIVHNCPYSIKLSFQQYPESICQEGPKKVLPPITISEVMGQTVEQSVNWHENQLKIVSKENIVVGNNPAIRLIGTWKQGGMKPELKDTKHEVVFIKTKKPYKVDLSYLEIDKEGKSQEKYKKAFDQIIKSLEFNPKTQ